MAHEAQSPPGKLNHQDDLIHNSGDEKISTILLACKDPHNLTSLITCATSPRGLVNDELRRVAWPILLGCNSTTGNAEKSSSPWKQLPRHKDEDQVRLDVNRSFIYYPNNESEAQLDRRKGELSDVITEVLRRHPMLCYFQGFHDIVQVFLLVLGVHHAADAVAHLSLLRIRDFMLPSLSPSIAHLQLLPTILYSVDANLCQHLSQTQPFFALAATLTLYAHDIQEYGDIARLFDFLLAQEAVVSIYLFAIIILSRRDELFEISADEPEMLHSVLSKLPKPLDLEALISKTTAVFSDHPPERLPFSTWTKVSSSSVLKTTRNSLQRQTLLDGEKIFARQVDQLRRAEVRERVLARIWEYRRPTRRVGLAIAVVVLAVWIRKRGMEHAVGAVTQKLSGAFRSLFA